MLRTAYGYADAAKRLGGERMREVLLGIDVGTSACKVVAFLKDGSVLAHASAPYRVYYPHTGWAEQEPDEWWNGVCNAIHQVIEKGVSPREICGIGIDGQSWSAIAVDKRGSVLCRTPIWMDTRASEQCRWMKEQCKEERLFRVSGNSLQPVYTMPKVLWYKKHTPEVYNEAYQILQSNGFIAWRLTGNCSQDHSQGYGWSCYDISAGAWDIELCRELGIREDLLPPLMACHDIVGGVTGKAAQETGLLEGTPVVAGGLDAACGALGAGVIHSGQTQEQGGQAGGMSICMNRPLADRRLILSHHVVPGYWLLQGGTVGGGAAVKWFVQEFGAAWQQEAEKNHTDVFYEMNREAKNILPGSEGLLFLPYLAGERSPVWNSNAKGVFYGIDFAKKRGHFARAVMEGVAFSLQHNLKVAEEAEVSVGVLRSIGGSANSPVWMQIKADVTGKQMEVPYSDTATALGAAILAGVGIGAYADFEQAVKNTVHINKIYVPNEENTATYEEGYRRYCDLYQNLKSMMDDGNEEE